MNIYTIGFSKKSAEFFFNSIKKNNIDILVDIRLNNTSQLSGFAKNKDLEYFLYEISKCIYYHDTIFAPSSEILKSYKSKKKSWEEYEKEYNNLIIERNMVLYFFDKYKSYNNICLLCSEDKPDNCHRRLLADALKKENNSIFIIHL